MWKRYRDTLTFVPPTKGRQAIPQLTDEMLDTTERQVALKFPKSYREFVKQIGIGGLFDYYLIYGPQLPRAVRRRHHYSIVAHNRTRRREYDLGGYDDRDLAERAVIFASTIAGEEFGWDPGGSTRHGSERDIYIYTRLSPEIQKIAETFKEFICEFCDSDNRLAEIVGGQGWRESGYPPTFRLATVRR